MAEGDAWEFFGWDQAAETMATLAALRREAIALGRQDIQLAISRIGVELQNKLDALSRTTAKAADEAIVRHLRQHARRPLTTRTPHLADQVKSIQFGEGLGYVKVALIDELDKAVNPDGSGRYWNAIEYGSVEVGNIMEGRRLYGSFSGGGSDDERPREMYRRDVLGDTMAPHAEFIMGGGSDPEKGIIHNEIEGRHFLRDGTDEAWTGYTKGVREIDRWLRNEVAKLSGPQRG